MQFNTGVELIKYIVEEIKNIYGHEIKISPETLVGHCHVTPKWKPNCPGKEFPFGNLIDRINNENILEKRLFIINGKEIELDCVVDNGKTYAPVRPIAEQLGAEVNYNGINKVTTITDK